MNYENLNEFLAWLAGPAGALACFVYVSSLIRGLQSDGKLTKLAPWQVQLLVMGVSLTVPIGALVIVSVLPAETIEQAQGVYSIVAAIAIAYLGQQGYYMMSKPKTNDVYVIGPVNDSDDDTEITKSTVRAG